MKIVVIGLGDLGRHLLSALDEEGHELVAIDRDPANTAAAEDEFDVRAISGYGAGLWTLEAAGAEEADLVIAVSDDDEVNLIAALAAKEFGAKRAIARVQGREWAQWTEGIRQDFLGVDLVINPPALVARELARIARAHGATQSIVFARGELELVQLKLDGLTRETPLSELPLLPSIQTVGILRGDRIQSAGAHSTLLEGDRLYLFGARRDIERSEAKLGLEHPAKRVILLGGDLIGVKLARLLRRKSVEVLIVEKDRTRAEELAAELIGVDVLHGDATSSALYESEDLDRFDLFISTSRSDEVNLVACLLAKRAGVPRAASMVQRAEYAPIYRELGVDIVVAQTLIAADEILRSTRGSETVRIESLDDEQSEIIEYQVRLGAPIVGMSLSEVRFPKGVLALALLRGAAYHLASEAPRIRPGDRLLIFSPHGAKDALSRLFRAG